MKKFIIAVVVIAVIIVAYVALQDKPVENENALPQEEVQQEQQEQEAQTVSYEGRVTGVDLEQMAVDGPGLVMFETEAGESRTVAVPSMGLPLCAGAANIASVSDIEVGDTIAVQGTLDSEGRVVPCEDASHYLRVEA